MNSFDRNYNQYSTTCDISRFIMALHYFFLFCLVIAVNSAPDNRFKFRNNPFLYVDSHYKLNHEYNFKFDYKFHFNNKYGFNYGSKTMPDKFSMADDCARTCQDNEKPRICYYHFTMEHYTTMGRACDFCKPNNTNQIASTPQCQCVEADGFERPMLSINRMLPGPSIQVCQNDKIVVDVQNNIEGLEVTLHWHGIWQQGSQFYDGVPFLTQCPIISGTTFRYQFVAGNPGTHFYHSHTGLQKMDGQYGSLIVRQPLSADPHMKLYDHDHPTHVIVLSDWLHEISSGRFPGRFRDDQGQLPVTVLINGKGQWKDPATNQLSSVQLESFTVQPGKRYRFRLINSFSSVCPAQVIIEGHSVLLIAQDGEIVDPVPVNSTVTSSGERVDFILEANQTAGVYWIQVRAIGECNTSNHHQLAILRYGEGSAMPKTPRPEYLPGLAVGKTYNDPEANCEQSSSDNVCAVNLRSLKPIPKGILRADPDVRIQLPYRFVPYVDEDLFMPGTYSRYLATGGRRHISSLVDGISFAFPRVPPLTQYVNSSDTCNRMNLPKDCVSGPCTCPHTHHVKKGAVVEVIVYDEVPDTSARLAHPFHLHGYAFHLLKIGQFPNGTTNSTLLMPKIIEEHRRTMVSGQRTQPAGKDTVSVNKNGYVIFRFKADNPGWWLFHCHFLYHVAVGMNSVFHVGDDKNDLPDVPPLFPTCSSYTPDVV